MPQMSKGRRLSATSRLGTPVHYERSLLFTLLLCSCEVAMQEFGLQWPTPWNIMVVPVKTVFKWYGSKGFTQTVFSDRRGMMMIVGYQRRRRRKEEAGHWMPCENYAQCMHNKWGPICETEFHRCFHCPIEVRNGKQGQSVVQSLQIQHTYIVH